MFDERAFIAQVESAGPEELANLLVRPTVEQEKALRAHLGDQRYQRMHSMALKRNISRSVGRSVGRSGAGPEKRNVVVIHGIMGAELSVSSNNGGSGDLTWVNAFRIIRGWVERLRLSADGRSEFNSKYRVRASGIMKRYYGELILSLAENWTVEPFWFDWRKDLDLAADELNVKINDRFGNDPVHIVAHSMGGLVARTFIQRYGERWEAMREKDPELRRGGRLIMLGTPNHGSFAIPQVITGLEGLVRKISLLDIRHRASELLNTFNSFVGSYQMMPSDLIMPEVKFLYDAGTYSRYNVTVSQVHLNNAREHHKLLQNVVDEERMIYVAGYDQPTFSGIKGALNGNGDGSKDRKDYRLDSVEGYEMTFDGDGRVSHQLGFRDEKGKRMFKTYFIREDHGNLSANTKVLMSLDELLETGETHDLYDDLEEARRIASRSMPEDAAAGADGRNGDQKRSPEEVFRRLQEEDQARLQTSLRRMGNSRGANYAFELEPDSEQRATPDEELAQKYISPEERKVEETVTRGFLSYRGNEESESEEEEDYEEISEPTTLEIGLVYGGIESIPYESIRTSGRFRHAIDAVAVGHYVGVRPAKAEGALDEAISLALAKGGQDPPRTDNFILTQYTERGIIHGKLGQPFFLPDPRDKKGARLIVIAGMGEPGRFAAPELTVMVRELCWSLGRLHKRHLATVLIGTGMGNLGLRGAIAAWMDGIRRAITGSVHDQQRRLWRITFVENNPSRLLPLDQLLSEEKEHQKRSGLEITYLGPSKEDLAKARRDDQQWITDSMNQRWQEAEERWTKREKGGKVESRDAGRDASRAPAATRVTLSLDVARKTYRFGAITDTASVPEREVTIDPVVVMQANDELAGERSPRKQKERGRFLEELLMPDELRAQLYNKAPLVMLLDSTTARIHWEMVAQPELISSPVGDAAPVEGDERGFNPNSFLGTSRGFTRQLRTTLAPPPEPPPPPRRVLRVLVVADPAADAHLPGAQEEGVAVADLFESFNAIYKEMTRTTRVEVKRLFGPLEATRTNVLREVMLRSYDVLHFAGHCVYQWGGDPTLSGWVFNVRNKELLTANELTRIDRIPKFVFSNACESGITPDRSQERSVDLAPSFAEAFFARGVANFVCTAWPVDDFAARLFALTFYSSLLGIKLDRKALGLEDSADEEKAWVAGDRRQEPMFMHEAIKEARTTIARLLTGRLTWGAYQHYGNPYFQFFQRSTTDSTESQRSARARKTTGRGTTTTTTTTAPAAKGAGRKASASQGAKPAGQKRSSRKGSRKAGKKGSKKR